MPQSDEKYPFSDLKEWRDKIETRQNDHGDRLLKVEIAIHEKILPAVEEIARDTKDMSKGIADINLKLVEKNSDLKNLSDKFNEMQKNQDKPSILMDIFKDFVKVVIIAALLGGLYFASLHGKL